MKESHPYKYNSLKRTLRMILKSQKHMVVNNHFVAYKD